MLPRNCRISRGALQPGVTNNRKEIDIHNQENLNATLGDKRQTSKKKIHFQKKGYGTQLSFGYDCATDIWGSSQNTVKKKEIVMPLAHRLTAFFVSRIMMWRHLLSKCFLQSTWKLGCAISFWIRQTGFAIWHQDKDCALFNYRDCVPCKVKNPSYIIPLRILLSTGRWAAGLRRPEQIAELWLFPTHNACV